jgi:hypothetical protein
MELIGPYLVACCLLVVAGVAKAARPDDTARAVVQLLAAGGTSATGSGPAATAGRGRLLRLDTVRTGIRLGASAEALLGLVALVLPRAPIAAAVAASYLVFSGVVLAAMVKGGVLATCGCFGTPDTPPTAVHLVVNLLLAGAAASVAVAAPATGTVVHVLRGQPWQGVPLVGISALGAWLAYLTQARLATLEAVRRQVAIRAGQS